MDGLIFGTEACDDGNDVDADGCEDDSTLTHATEFTCVHTGTAPDPATSCIPLCGDGVIVLGEDCDEAHPAEPD